MKGKISIRLEGGIGDHVLGMRILPFIKKVYPKHKIIAYSDCGGHPAPAKVARMSPFLSQVISVRHKKRFSRITSWGSVKNIRTHDLGKMMAADLFFDAWNAKFFIEAARILNIPFYEILNQRTKLVIPDQAKLKASEFLKPYKKKVFVGLNVTKFGLGFFKQNKKIVLSFLKELLKDPRIVVLNFYTSDYKFPHWPIPLSFDREEAARKEYLKIAQLWNIDKKVVPVANLPIFLVAALIKRCGYFIGVDNGIKHLAWALGIPHTFFVPEDIRDNVFILRWMPDFHRHLLFNCKEKDFLNHLQDARKEVSVSKK
jgi:ADP-heptose:LPS heptosyltransferase